MHLYTDDTNFKTIRAHKDLAPEGSRGTIKGPTHTGPGAQPMRAQPIRARPIWAQESP